MELTLYIYAHTPNAYQIDSEDGKWKIYERRQKPLLKPTVIEVEVSFLLVDLIILENLC